MAAIVKQGAKLKYPLATMPVGEFFFLPGRARTSFAPYLSVAAKTLGRRFTTRTCFMMEQIDGWVEVSEDHPYALRGLGVWRVS